MSTARHHPAPPALEKRGLTRATESAPGSGDFRIRNAGHRLGVLFRDDLLRLQAQRAAAKKEVSA